MVIISDDGVSSLPGVITHYLRGCGAPQQNFDILEAARMFLITLQRPGYFCCRKFWSRLNIRNSLEAEFC